VPWQTGKMISDARQKERVRKLDFIATLLNLKASKPELPSEFADVFDKQKYEESQRYTQANSKFHIISSVFSSL